jgi:hypothetical protein
MRCFDKNVEDFLCQCQKYSLQRIGLFRKYLKTPNSQYTEVTLNDSLNMPLFHHFHHFIKETVMFG